MIKQLKQDLQKVLQINEWPLESFDVSTAKILRQGHYFSNILLIIAKNYHVTYQEISEKIIEYFKTNCQYVKEVKTTNNYLYFIINEQDLNSIVNEILIKKGDFGKITLEKDINVNYEWVSANPTGFLHVGHARNIFAGQAITNLLEFAGYKVTREYYINDYGNQVYQLGRTIHYYYQKELGLKPKFDEDMYKNSEVIILGKLALDQLGPDYKNIDFANHPDIAQKFIDLGTDYFLNEMKILLKKCDVIFDVWFSEKSLYQTKDNLQNLIKKLDENEHLYRKDGAIWFKNKSGKYAADFVLQKADGNSTYFSGDIMYHNDKYVRKFDQVIDLWGGDHYGHYLKIKAGLAALGWNAETFEVDLLHMVKILKNGKALKISKRQGTTIPIVEILKIVNLDFLRFMLLSRKRTTKLEIDLGVAKKINNKNPLFYVQYMHARCAQIIAKSQLKPVVLKDSYQHLTSSIENRLILSLHEFEYIIADAASHREPQYLISFILKVAKLFHNFYENILILVEDQAIQQERINLIKALQQMMQNSFKIIGISAPEKM